MITLPTLPTASTLAALASVLKALQNSKLMATCRLAPRGVAGHEGRALPAASQSPAHEDGPGCPPRELPSGCGWFDSSHELQCGLRVQELSPPQLDMQVLPLAVWLDLQLLPGATALRLH